MGLRNIENKLSQEAEMRKKGAETAIQMLDDLSKKLKSVHKELEKLEKEYKNDLKKNPQLSAKIMSLREELGLPKAIGIYDLKHKGSILSKFKNNKEFINYLAMRILEIGKVRTKDTGGIMSSSDIILRLNEQYEGVSFEISDIMDALKLLQSNKLINNIRSIAGLQIVEFIDQNMTKDQELLLEIAIHKNGLITINEAIRETSWTLDRLNRILEGLIQNKIAKKKETLDGIVYIFPSIG